MKYQKDYQEDDLLISLRNLMRYSQDPYNIDNSKDFVEFYNRTISILINYGTATGNMKFLEMTDKFPVLFEDDVEKFRNQKNKQTLSAVGGASLTGIIIGFFITVIALIIKIKKTENINDLFRVINDTCGHLIFIIENPVFFEQKNK
ncbi:MAG: hypothetical protein A2W91_15835 [Bacteroidetes bacterium GWF2_38_335]|nr:MAG: hypothetical protein A2W91_15835 [Bacteroidetes bacterium GWF2_38_335]OFY81164.1 MAG: hypothetical protein A2281_06810 [Bacteroidetes bacterium RIFOXYA12_FULL_38_20]HBS85276.1 hypothetical protein [Bacteroidales bacterium]